MRKVKGLAVETLRPRDVTGSRGRPGRWKPTALPASFRSFRFGSLPCAARSWRECPASGEARRPANPELGADVGEVILHRVDARRRALARSRRATSHGAPVEHPPLGRSEDVWGGVVGRGRDARSRRQPSRHPRISLPVGNGCGSGSIGCPWCNGGRQRLDHQRPRPAQALRHPDRGRRRQLRRGRGRGVRHPRPERRGQDDHPGDDRGHAPHRRGHRGGRRRRRGLGPARGQAQDRHPAPGIGLLRRAQPRRARSSCSAACTAAIPTRWPCSPMSS